MFLIFKVQNIIIIFLTYNNNIIIIFINFINIYPIYIKKIVIRDLTERQKICILYMYYIFTIYLLYIYHIKLLII